MIEDYEGCIQVVLMRDCKPERIVTMDRKLKRYFEADGRKWDYQGRLIGASMRSKIEARPVTGELVAELQVELVRARAGRLLDKLQLKTLSPEKLRALLSVLESE